MLQRLKRRLGLATNEKDDLLTDLLTDAGLYTLAYTRQLSLPPQLEGVVLELAAISYNRLGMQGEVSHAEGGVSMTVESLPKHIAVLMDSYRLAKVGE